MGDQSKGVENVYTWFFIMGILASSVFWLGVFALTRKHLKHHFSSALETQTQTANLIDDHQ